MDERDRTQGLLFDILQRYAAARDFLRLLALFSRLWQALHLSQLNDVIHSLCTSRPQLIHRLEYSI